MWKSNSSHSQISLLYKNWPLGCWDTVLFVSENMVLFRREVKGHSYVLLCFENGTVNFVPIYIYFLIFQKRYKIWNQNLAHSFLIHGAPILWNFIGELIIIMKIWIWNYKKTIFSIIFHVYFLIFKKRYKIWDQNLAQSLLIHDAPILWNFIGELIIIMKIWIWNYKNSIFSIIFHIY